MTTTLSRRIPPQRLITLMNPLVRTLLRSPLHRAVDNTLLALHIVGRRTRRRYDIPVGFMDLGGGLVVVTQHRWRANLRGGADIEVTHAGSRRAMRAELDEEPASVAATLDTACQRVGWRATQRQTGLTRPGHAPTRAELEEAVREYDLAAITLTTR
ncbi:MAG TPA: hypothetical protein VFH03_07000 [Actinoplanes sp.]|nr:hypothetical protein [Actinoplanes sp.]